MNGQFYRELERLSIDKENPLAWLCSSGLKVAADRLTF
jgi:hypothetical protein